MRLDHVVIYVSDLDTAIQDFADLGFNLQKGGSHAFTENALIIFSDGTYIELLALKTNWRRPLIRMAAQFGIIKRQAEKKSDMYWRLLRWICSGQGLVDWCALAPDMVAALATCKEEDCEIVPPQEFERMRPDGKVAKLSLIHI